MTEIDYDRCRTADELANKYGYWCEHPKFSTEAWQQDVADRATRLGYWEWVRDLLEQEA